MRHLLLFASLFLFVADLWAERPNVILVMSDDQGYGDFGAVGNKVIETPSIDAMAKRSVLWDNFYVSPVCSPTRASLMTGRYNHRTYCVDTWLGRSMMATEETTIAEVLHEAGYATGIFGKWHLGDNYPMRTIDQGFEESLVLRGGGLAQPADPIENNRRYTNPILMHNGRKVQTTGYCTDVYFDHAMKWMRKIHNEGRSFFTYIPTNAPHGPFHDVPEDLRKYYLKKDLKSLIRGKVRNVEEEVDTLSRIAAMITNVDENMGRLFDMLKENGLYENTLVFFLTDNGPNTMRYVGDMRGMKSNVLEGGVRTVLWSHWPARLQAGVTVQDTVAAHIDLFPTIAEACGVAVPAGLQLDGRSILSQLVNPGKRLAPRTLFMQIHRGSQPQRYHNMMVRDSMWKLVHPSGFQTQTFEGEPDFQLYNLDQDPGEEKNLIMDYPQKFAYLKSLYDAWFDDVMSNVLTNPGPPDIIIDGAHENPSVLTWQDRVADRWSKGSEGHWELNFAHSGNYQVQVDMPREYAPEADAEVLLFVGEEAYKIQVKQGTESVQFPAIFVAEGPNILKAEINYPDGKVEGGYQVRVTTL
ncbi:MAG: arylsulfatase [Verrucomicrobiae bacterium]|nr:arylsulfatase [Verrucomicrobiae bacterium]